MVARTPRHLVSGAMRVSELKSVIPKLIISPLDKKTGFSQNSFTRRISTDLM